MSESEFRAKRRQKFLTEKYFRKNQHALDFLFGETVKSIPKRKAEGDLDPFGEGGLFKDSLKILRLHYTAGEPIESLKPLFADAMKWLGEWHRAEHDYSIYLAKKSGKDLRLDMTPIEFADLFHFQLALDVVSLGVLLGDGDAVRQAAQWMHSARHTDMLFEAIVEPVFGEPSTVEEFFHEKPYDPLLDAVYVAQTPEEASALVKQYLDGWYKAFEGVPWHDGHLVQTEEYSNYEGYWAFEAAAVCVIHGIDDTSFRDHIVYPKDLADWARANNVMARLAPGGGGAGSGAARPTCQGGAPCPREGFWFTPAKAGSRRVFKQGEVMPEFKSDWGSIIWQWDENQSA